MKHTEGPWRVDTLTGSIGSVINANGDVVAQAQQIKPMPSDVMQMERKANACLIAAAPQLLEALELFMDMFNSGDLGSSSKRAQQRRADMWDKANDAIAKSRGAL